MQNWYGDVAMVVIPSFKEIKKPQKEEKGTGGKESTETEAWTHHHIVQLMLTIAPDQIKQIILLPDDPHRLIRIINNQPVRQPLPVEVVVGLDVFPAEHLALPHPVGAGRPVRI